MESLEMTPQFWLGKKVFLTGHTGFKGSWLSLWLQELGANVTGYALKSPTDPSLYELANVALGMNSITGDIRDRGALAAALNKSQPDIVIHMAAQSLVRESYLDPVLTYETNVMGTVNLLDAIRNCSSVRAVVNVTTDKCYENKEWLWGYRENEALGGYDPYSNSKACAELVTAAYRSSFFNDKDFDEHGVALASVRAGNVIGGGDWAKDRLIPDILKAFSSNHSAAIRYPNAIRPWQHVLAPLHGYLLLTEKLFDEGPKYAEGWNFGPSESDAKPVAWIANNLVEMWGNGATWHAEDLVHPHEANYLKLDTSKARARLNWEPHLTLDEALKLIVEWTKGYRNGANVREITTSQIKRYQERLLSK